MTISNYRENAMFIKYIKFQRSVRINCIESKNHIIHKTVYTLNVIPDSLEMIKRDKVSLWRIFLIQTQFSGPCVMFCYVCI